MTLGASLKLILNSLLQKCCFSGTIWLPNILNSNQKLQQFIENKINEMNDIKNLVSSNMSISENLSFISIYYDYLYRLFWDYYVILSRYSKQLEVGGEDPTGYDVPRVSNELWSAIASLEQNIFLLLLSEKKNQNKSAQKFTKMFTNVLQD